MVQTTQDYNSKFDSGKKMPATFRNVTVKIGQGVLAPYTALMLELATGKYIKADTNVVPADTTEEGWSILLEEADTTADIVAKVGVTGEIDEDDVVLAGANLVAMNETAKVLFGMNNIFINQKTDSISAV